MYEMDKKNKKNKIIKKKINNYIYNTNDSSSSSIYSSEYDHFYSSNEYLTDQDIRKNRSTSYNSNEYESEDEGIDGYKIGGYHPVIIGEIYNKRFIVVEKIGWGHFSTVWRCYDNLTDKYVAMKVQKSSKHYTEAALDEIELLNCVNKNDTNYSNNKNNNFDNHIVKLITNFEHIGPNGKHVCMIFEMLGDNLLSLIKYYNYRGIPIRIVKKIVKCILNGLKYLHENCNIIHTDLKPENVLLTSFLPKKIRHYNNNNNATDISVEKIVSPTNDIKITNDGLTLNELESLLITNENTNLMSKDEVKILKKKIKNKKNKIKKKAIKSTKKKGEIFDNPFEKSDESIIDSSVDIHSNNLKKLQITAPDQTADEKEIVLSNFIRSNQNSKKHMVLSATDIKSTRLKLQLSLSKCQDIPIGNDHIKILFFIPKNMFLESLTFLEDIKTELNNENNNEWNFFMHLSSNDYSYKIFNECNNQLFFQIKEHIEDKHEQIINRIYEYLDIKENIYHNYDTFVISLIRERVEFVLNVLETAIPMLFFIRIKDNNNKITSSKIVGYYMDRINIDTNHSLMHIHPLSERIKKCKMYNCSHSKNRKKSNLDEVDIEFCNAKIADLGNSCFFHNHFSDDIQTRQYRSPEVILKNKRYKAIKNDLNNNTEYDYYSYNYKTDYWSLGCLIFELLTGDLLFDPKSCNNGKVCYSRDEDHLAQFIELLGKMPKSFIKNNIYGNINNNNNDHLNFFDKNGNLRNIKKLKMWCLLDVLQEKYNFNKKDAEEINSFLLLFLQYEPDNRQDAVECLKHLWLQDV